MNDFLILLQAKLDEAKSQGNINKDIDSLQGKLDKLKLQATIDPKTVQTLTKEIEKVINQKIVISNIGINQSQATKSAQQTGQKIGNAINQGITNTVSKTTNSLKSFTELKIGTGNIDAILDKDGVLDIEQSLNKVKQIYSEFGQVKITNKIFDPDGNLQQFRVDIQQVNGELKESRNFMMALASDGKSFNFPQDIIKGSESFVHHLNEAKNLSNATGEELNAQKEKLAEQEKYYSRIKEEVTLLYNLEQKLLSADELQTAELEKQIKSTKQRITYNNQQIDKKELRDSSLDREIINLEVAKQKQLALSEARIQDVANVKAVTKALKEQQSLQSQINKIQLLMDNGHGASEYQNRINAVTASLEKYGIETKEAQNITASLQSTFDNMKGMSGQELASQADKLEKEFKAVKASVEQSKIAYDKYMQPVSKEKATSLINRINTFLSKNTRITKDAKMELQGYVDELGRGVNLSKWNEINGKLKDTENSMRGLHRLGASLKDQMSQAAQSFTQWLSVSSAVMLLLNQLRKMPKEVIEVNSAMVELNKVSDASASDIKKYFDEAAESAKELGTSVSDLITATADWSRLGYNLPDSKKLAEVATLYKNVGDGIDINTANESLVSTLQGFKLEANDAMHIIDAFNEVGNNFAIGSDGIGEALKRSASSMYAAGNTLEETIGLVTAANAIVQDPDSIGTAYKTISMRIRAAKTEMEEFGLDTDGMVESTATLREEIMALSGVDIMKDKDTFKSTYQILDELATKWQDLTDIQQASITELIAGKRQGNIISALMTNFETARQATETAVNSTGSALKEQEAYEQGIQYSLDRLEASFQTFANHVLDSDFLKGIVDLGTKSVSSLEGIVKVLEYINSFGGHTNGTGGFLGAISGLVMNKMGIGERAIMF